MTVKLNSTLALSFLSISFCSFVFVFACAFAFAFDRLRVSVSVLVCIHFGACVCLFVCLFNFANPKHHYFQTCQGSSSNHVFHLTFLDSSGTCIPSNHTTVYMAGEGMAFGRQEVSQNPEKGWCIWNISVPVGNFIKLTFLWIDMSPPCNESYVEVYDITNSTRIPLGKFCHVPEYSNTEVYSRGNNLIATYVTVSNASPFSDIGFLATYETVKAVPVAYACRKSHSSGYPVTLLQSTDGEFASYQYPLPYSNDVHCSWRIKAPFGFIVIMTFHAFELQHSQDCEADYVEIKQEQGKSIWRTSEIVGRFCGSSLPGVIQSNRSIVLVDFVTDSSGRYPGFRASYKTIPNRK